MTASPTSTAADTIELSIVMPCLDEAETLQRCIEKAQSFLRKHHIVGEIVIGDNGSTDGSVAIAQQCGARVVHVPVRGYGAAVYHAVQASRGRYVIMGDADDSYDFTSLEAFVGNLRDGCDLVMGNRFKGGIASGAMPWQNKWIGNPVLTSIGRVLFHCPVRDFHCGLRGFSRQAFDRMDLRTTGMEFASEMVVKATLLKMKIAEVPTTLARDGRSRPPHLRPLRDGWRHLRFMLLFSPRWLFAYPGMLLVVLGTLVSIWLWPGQRHVGSVSFDVHTLLYAAVAVLLGYQAVAFAYLSKVFVVQSGLMPDDPQFRRWRRYVTLETGLIVGTILFVLGLFGTVAAVWNWGETSFGELDPRQMLRAVVPAGFALTLGCQIILTSFFLSVLELRTRKM